MPKFRKKPVVIEADMALLLFFRREFVKPTERGQTADFIAMKAMERQDARKGKV